MKKEALIAILLGIGLGLVFTFGIYTANQSINQKKTEQTAAVVENSPTPTPTSELVIESPENNRVYTANNVEVKGTTSPQSTLVVFSADHETFTQADQEGVFSVKFPLVKGTNLIKVTSIDQDNNSTEQDLKLVYSSEI